MDELVELLNAAVERAQEQENQRATGGKVAAKIKEIGARPAAELARADAGARATCARSTPTWASARISIALPPTPISRSRSASRPFPSARAGRAAAPTHPRSGTTPKAATSDSNAFF